MLDVNTVAHFIGTNLAALFIGKYLDFHSEDM
jgi:hypothetical protein